LERKKEEDKRDSSLFLSVRPIIIRLTDSDLLLAHSGTNGCHADASCTHCDQVEEEEEEDDDDEEEVEEEEDEEALQRFLHNDLDPATTGGLSLQGQFMCICMYVCMYLDGWMSDIHNTVRLKVFSSQRPRV
jgi:hypothetical protein